MKKREWGAVHNNKQKHSSFQPIWNKYGTSHNLLLFSDHLFLSWERERFWSGWRKSTSPICLLIGTGNNKDHIRTYYFDRKEKAVCLKKERTREREREREKELCKRLVNNPLVQSGWELNWDRQVFQTPHTRIDGMNYYPSPSTCSASLCLSLPSRLVEQPSRTSIIVLVFFM